MNNKKKICITILLVVGIFLSIFVGAKYFSNPENFPNTIAYLNQKRNTVLELTATSSASSIALTLIPGDIATPIADQLADLSSKFIIILGAIYLEKYLITVGGLFVWTVLIPVFFIVLIMRQWKEGFNPKQLQTKLAILSLVFIGIVPVSTKVSMIIENTYESNFSETISQAEENNDLIEEENEKGIFDQITGAFDFSKHLDNAKTTLNNFIESIAVMIVTSCVIPLLVLFGLIWIVQAVLGININIPSLSSNNSVKRKKHRLMNKVELE